MVEERVGMRVRVYWAEEEEWFEGTIQEYDRSQGFYVVYDDGDERWEPSDQRIEVEGEDEEEQSDAAESDEPVNAERDCSRAPEMMEPPASPGSAYDEMEREEKLQNTGRMDVHEVDALPGAHETPQLDDQSNNGENNYQQDKELYEHNYEQAEGLDGEQTDSIGIFDDDDGNNDAESDDEKSVAESEIPQTFDKRSNSMFGVRRAPSKADIAPVPSKGLLVGKVLRASSLRTSDALAPNAFVKTAFVESGDTTHASAILRCKQTLSTTRVVRSSIDPVWNEEPLIDQNAIDFESGANGEFQLKLLPRIIPPATAPAWHQLPGDVLFTVYSALRSDASTRSGANEHIGQATVSLRSLLHDLFTSSPFATRVLELRSRSGRRIGRGNVSTSSLFENDRTDAPMLVVSFRFFPSYEIPAKPKAMSGVSSMSKFSRVVTAKINSGKDSRRDESQSAKRLAPAQMSSSSINRRRFEKKVAIDNQSFAKRLEWKAARRSRRIAEAKSQDKRKMTLPQHGARKHGHKASSEINRTKYVQQVAQENKAIGKRLQNILGADAGAHGPGTFCRWATAEAKDSSSYDYMDRDKTYVQDKRWQRQVELDFMMEKAQTKYQQQNQIVEEVMELQESVAGLKTQLDTLSKGVTRLDILTKKDQHVRDCLVRATATSNGSAEQQSPRQTKAFSRGSSKTTKHSSDNNQEGSVSTGKNRKMQELELLMQHQDRLQADKRKISQELQTLNQQETDLDKEISDLQAKWELAVATKLFHKQMEKKTMIQTQKAEQEMKRRQKAMELSREEEEQWKCYQTHQEITQLQIAIQVLRDKCGDDPRRVAATRASSSSLTTVCDYLTKKIDKQKTKLRELEGAVERRRRDYEALLVGGGNEKLRYRVQELQKLVFLCKAQATHVKQAERLALRKGEQMELQFRGRMFDEQTETEIVLKRLQKL